MKNSLGDDYVSQNDAFDIQYYTLGYANDPPKGEYMAPTRAVFFQANLEKNPPGCGSGPTHSGCNRPTKF